MGSPRDDARAEIASRGLAPAAIEHLTRVALPRLPIALLERARTLLRRFFSDAPFGTDEESALAGIVGPGTGWDEHPLDADLTIGYGWRGGAFRLDARDGGTASAPSPATPSGSPATTTAATASAMPPAAGPAPEGIAATFDGPVVPEFGPTPTQIRFLTGPGTGGSTLWFRSTADATDPRVAQLLTTFTEIAGVQLGAGFVAVEIRDPNAWHRVLMPILDRVGQLFAAERPPPSPDRQAERARAELGGLRAGQPRDLARITDALTSPDAAHRQVAVTLVAAAEPATAERAWRAAVADNSRAVRRAAVIGMAATSRPWCRPLLERALSDGDACVRYHAVEGLAAIGADPSRAGLERLARDSDARVRLAAEAALTGRRPGAA